ncbi:MAG TPA: SDR family NAD(P)-dependent oxidoreductase [Vicinamibacterales bacterium]|nr:SDR family NAD(P)-dependent oxidoreductase [Vicinamibacterales bacterium]
MTPAADLLRLDGRVAVVAGGAGAIGRAIASRLFECGARVYILDLPGRTGPHGTETVACDLTQPSAVSSAVDRIGREEGRLDIVVHAAGITRDARVWKLSDEDWRAVLSVNLDSAFALVRAATPLLRSGRDGSVVLISSINARRGKVGLAAYAASKAGLEALARTAARDLGDWGVRVNAVAPGWITTPMTDAVPAEFHERAIAETALGRLGEPDDVARAVLFLAGDLGRHVTGQTVTVDGGQT